MTCLLRLSCHRPLLEKTAGPFLPGRNPKRYGFRLPALSTASRNLVESGLGCRGFHAVAKETEEPLQVERLGKKWHRSAPCRWGKVVVVGAHQAAGQPRVGLLQLV